MASTKWTIDPAHSEINFRVKHMMISTVTGGFEIFQAGFEINGEVNRKDYGLVWDAVTETGGIVLADTVRIHCHVELIRQQQQQAA